MAPLLRLEHDEIYEFQINSVQNCEECEDYAEELRKFINTIPGWKAGGGTLTFLSPLRRGIKIFMTKDGPPNAVGRKLVAALNAANILVDMDETNTSGPATIVIGRRL